MATLEWSLRLKGAPSKTFIRIDVSVQENEGFVCPATQPDGTDDDTSTDTGLIIPKPTGTHFIEVEFGRQAQSLGTDVYQWRPGQAATGNIVSRHHCRIRLYEDGHVEVKDDKSHTGTFILEGNIFTRIDSSRFTTIPGEFSPGSVLSFYCSDPTPVITPPPSPISTCADASGIVPESLNLEGENDTDETESKTKRRRNRKKAKAKAANAANAAGIGHGNGSTHCAAIWKLYDAKVISKSEAHKLIMQSMGTKERRNKFSTRRQREQQSSQQRNVKNGQNGRQIKRYQNNQRRQSGGRNAKRKNNRRTNNGNGNSTSNTNGNLSHSDRKRNNSHIERSKEHNRKRRRTNGNNMGNRNSNSNSGVVVVDTYARQQRRKFNGRSKKGDWIGGNYIPRLGNHWNVRN